MQLVQRSRRLSPSSPARLESQHFDCPGSATAAVASRRRDAELQIVDGDAELQAADGRGWFQAGGHGRERRLDVTHCCHEVISQFANLSKESVYLSVLLHEDVLTSYQCNRGDSFT